MAVLPALNADLLTAPGAAPPALHRDTSEGTKHGPLTTDGESSCHPNLRDFYELQLGIAKLLELD